VEDLNIKPNFHDRVAKMKKLSSSTHPRHTFSYEIRQILKKDTDLLDWAEDMVSLFELYPALPLDTLEADDDIELLSHLVAIEFNSRIQRVNDGFLVCMNTFNEVGRAIFIRCLMECCAALDYLQNVPSEKKEKMYDNFLFGTKYGKFAKEKLWRQYKNEHPDDDPSGFVEFVKAFFDIPNILTIIEKYHKKHSDFGILYYELSQYAHPTFFSPRSRILAVYEIEESDAEYDAGRVAWDKYFDTIKEPPTHALLLTQDLTLAGLMWQRIWPYIIDLDTYLQRGVEIVYGDDFPV